MEPNNKEDLLLFNEKADVLLASSFAEAMLNNSTGVMFEWSTGNQPESIILGAEGESVDAAFLTLRMFIQNNDRISIANISKIYLNEAKLQPFAAEFESVKNDINVFLDKVNGIDFFGNNYTHKELIELLMYGSKGHTNRAKEKQLKEIQKLQFISHLFNNQVNRAVTVLMIGIGKLADINKNAIKSL